MSTPAHRPHSSTTHHVFQLARLLALTLVAYVAACIEGGGSPDEGAQGREPQSAGAPTPGETGYPAERSFRLALRDEAATQLHLWNMEGGQLAGQDHLDALPGALLAIGDLTGDRHDDIAFYGNTGELGWGAFRSSTWPPRGRWSARRPSSRSPT